MWRSLCRCLYLIYPFLPREGCASWLWHFFFVIVTLLLRDCDTSASWLLHFCFVIVALLLRDCDTSASWLWHFCFVIVALLLRDCSTSWVSSFITKTCLYNFDPLKPHFYVVKLRFTGVNIIFLISAQEHRLWVHVKTAWPRRFQRVLTSNVFSINVKNIRVCFYQKYFTVFGGEWNFQYIWIGVFSWCIFLCIIHSGVAFFLLKQCK